MGITFKCQLNLHTLMPWWLCLNIAEAHKQGATKRCTTSRNGNGERNPKGRKTRKEKAKHKIEKAMQIDSRVRATIVKHSQK